MKPLAETGARFHQRETERRIRARLGTRDRHVEGVDEEALLERTVVSHRAMIIIRRPLSDEHRGEMRRVERRRGALGRRHVRRSHRADLAGRPRLSRGPFDSVVAVGRLAREGVPFALGAAAPAHVLDQNDVAVLGEESRGHGEARGALVVRRALDEHRKAARHGRAAACGMVNIGREPHPVAHREHHVAFDHDLEIVRRSLALTLCHGPPPLLARALRELCASPRQKPAPHAR